MATYSKNNPESIQTMFSTIAKRYDRANAVLSLQMHKKWNAELVRRVSGSSSSGLLLDLCSGTGDIAFTYLKENKGKAVLLDFCFDMLSCAKEKAENFKVLDQVESFIQADAEKIPLKDNSVSHVTIAYGIRNIKNPENCIKEAFRVLKPGGVFGILELTRPKSALMRMGHQIYLRTALPLLGKWMTSNADAYQYLCNSIHQFIAPEKLASMLSQAGFQDTCQIPLTFGIATIITGLKKDT